jgi:chromosome segregation ATPase
LLLVLPLTACASAAKTAKPPGPVDLGPARAAVEDARRAGAPQSAAEAFQQAEAHLDEAEALQASGTLTVETALRAEFLARLAGAEARCAASLARLSAKKSAPDEAAARRDDLAGRLRRAEEERRRLEERVALLQRELELTETEVIRTKARLQGTETKADASSAIAEARILMGRVDSRDRATLGRCQELLSKAEKQINENNFGAAVFFARKVQDIVARARESPPSPSP